MVKQNKLTEEELIEALVELNNKIDDLGSKIEKPTNHYSDSIQTSVKIGDICLSSPNLTVQELNREAIKLLKEQVVSTYLHSEKNHNILNSRPTFT